MFETIKAMRRLVDERLAAAKRDLEADDSWDAASRADYAERSIRAVSLRVNSAQGFCSSDSSLCSE